MRHIYRTPQAEDDLIELWVWIGRENPEAADRLMDRIGEALKLIASRPEIGHFREDLADRRYRFWPVADWLIIYRADTDPLTVIRVWHSARDTPEL